MDITFNCEKCGQHIVIDEAGAGLEVQCPNCSQPLAVPKPVELLPSPPRASETKKCPFCAEEIRTDAIKCKHCGEFLNDSRKPRMAARSSDLPPHLLPH